MRGLQEPLRPPTFRLVTDLAILTGCCTPLSVLQTDIFSSSAHPGGTPSNHQLSKYAISRLRHHLVYCTSECQPAERFMLLFNSRLCVEEGESSIQPFFEWLKEIVLRMTKNKVSETYKKSIPASTLKFYHAKAGSWAYILTEINAVKKTHTTPSLLRCSILWRTLRSPTESY